MPTPFPGMDPYLERPGLWEQVHLGLIVESQQFLARLLRPTYRVEVDQRVYLATVPPEPPRFVGRPDVLVLTTPRSGAAALASPAAATVMPRLADLPIPDQVVERFLTIRHLPSGEVVTAIEILSPANKQPGEGRAQYERERLQVLESWTNLVEIDLLRQGEPPEFHLSNGAMQSDYRLIVSRAPQRPQADVYLFNVRDPIPDLPIPLRAREAEPMLPLNQILHLLYDEAGYDLAIDYTQPPTPPLRDEDAAWATTLIHR